MRNIFLISICCCLIMACGKSGQNTGDKGNADEAWQVDMGGGSGSESANGTSNQQTSTEENKQPPTVVLDAYQKQQLNDLTNRFCELKKQLENKQPSQGAAKFDAEEVKKQMSDIASEMRSRVEQLQDQMRAASVTSGDQWETLIQYLKLVQGY